MQLEIEAKFLNIDHDEIRYKLKTLGAVCEQPMRLMQRVTIENHTMKDKNAFLRVRDEGYRSTITYKQFDSLSVAGTKELEVTIGNFQTMIDILKAVGLPCSSFQESRRENWSLGGVEIVLDEWPWLKPYIEIEASSEIGVRQTAQRLGLKWKDAVFGDVMAAYRVQYPHLTDADTVGNITQVKFNDPLPKLLQG